MDSIPRLRSKYGLLAVLLLFFHPSTLLACSCVDRGGSEKQRIAAAYRQEVLIFIGRVLSVDTVVTTDTLQISDRGPVEQRIRLIQHIELRYTFAIATQFKGQTSGPTVLVYTNAQESACGKQFKIGSEQLVYAFQVREKASLYGDPPIPIDPYFATSICNRGQQLKNVRRAELKQLARLAKAG